MNIPALGSLHPDAQFPDGLVSGPVSVPYLHGEELEFTLEALTDADEAQAHDAVDAFLALGTAARLAASLTYEGDQLVGAARTISDGVRSSAIYHVVVLLEHQGRGISRRIMEDLLARMPSRSVLLLSVPAQCAFYEKLGFRMLKTAMVKHEDPTFFIQGGYME